MSNRRMTAEERTVRVEEIRRRFAAIDSEHAGEALSDSARAEWTELQQELTDHETAIADAAERTVYLRSLARQNPDATLPGADPASGYAADQAQRRNGQFGAVLNRRPDDIYDVAAAQRDARSPQELARALRDRARWSVEESDFPGERHRTREEVQTVIDGLLSRSGDRSATLARNMLLTGSETYQRAFGQLLIHNGNPGHLSTEEQRALQMGTPAAWSPGSYPVPYQLDPTVTLTSNGAINPLRQISRVEQIVGKEWLGVTSTGITVTRGSESTVVGDGTPTLVQPGVAPERVQGFVPFTVEVEQDWSGLLAEIAAMLADAKDVEEASSFTNGNGTAPNAGGIVGTLANGSLVATGSAGAITVPGDLDIIEAAMAPRFRPAASFIAAKSTFGAVRSAAVAAGDQFDVWARIASGTPPELIGYSAYENSEMSTDLTSTTVPFLVMGDFRQFLIVDRIGMTIELVPHLFDASTQRPSGQRGIYAIWRNNSAILAQNAFRGLVSAS